MANVLHKTRSPADYRVSVNTPDFPDSDWFHDPDVSAVAGLPLRYWQVGTNPVQAMTQIERDAVDAAIAAAQKAAAREAAVTALDGLGGYELRAIAAILIDEINNLRQWDSGLKAAFQANTTVANIRTAVLALPNMPDRKLSQAKTAYSNAISSGVVDD